MSIKIETCCVSVSMIAFHLSHLSCHPLAWSQQRWFLGSGGSENPGRSGGGSTVKEHKGGLITIVGFQKTHWTWGDNKNSLLPWVQRGLLRRRRWCEVSAHRGLVWGYEEKWDQRLRWCWGQIAASHAQPRCPRCCAVLKTNHNIILAL